MCSGDFQTSRDQSITFVPLPHHSCQAELFQVYILPTPPFLSIPKAQLPLSLVTFLEPFQQPPPRLAMSPIARCGVDLAQGP